MKFAYLGIEFTLGAILADQEGCRLVRLDSCIGKLEDLEFVGIAHRRRDEEFIGRIWDVLVVEFDANAIFS